MVPRVRPECVRRVENAGLVIVASFSSEGTVFLSPDNTVNRGLDG